MSSIQEQIENTNGVVLVDFYADWCAPCKQLAAQLPAVQSQLEDLTIIKVDIDTEEGSQLLSKHGVRSIPTLKKFVNGVEVGKKIGVMSKAQIIEWLGE